MGVLNTSYPQLFTQTKWRYVAVEAHDKIIHDEKKSIIFQFQVWYMFKSAFQGKYWKLSRICPRKYVFVLPLIIIYHNRTAFVYKVIGSVIYYIIDNPIFLDYLGIVQHKLSDYKNNFEKLSSMIFLYWVFLKLWWISCHVMVFKRRQHQQ